MLNKIKQFFIEKTKWKKAGKPYRSDDKIDQLFIICNECDKYQKKDDNEGSCGVCGCRITNKKELFNKIAWATTKCPLEDPRWIEEPEFQSIEITDQEVYTEEMPKIEEVEPTPSPPPARGCGCAG